MYVDFAGDRLEVVDEMTGETKKAEVFVAILPFSHYTYCEAVWSQRKEDLIKGCTAVRSIPPMYATPRTRPLLKTP